MKDKQTGQNSLIHVIQMTIGSNFPENINEMIKEGTIKFEIAPLGPANASVKKVEDTYIIKIYQSLDDIFYWAARILSCYPELMGIDEATSKMIDCIWMVQNTGILKPYHLNDMELMGQSYDPALSVAAINFLTCHEIGHIMIQLDEKDMKSPKEIEYLADHYAVKIMLGLYNDKRKHINIVPIYRGIILAFMVFYAKERLEGSENSFDHPSLQERILYVDEIISDYLTKEQLIELKTHIEDIVPFFAEMEQVLESDSYINRVNKLAGGKKQRMKKVKRILDEASNVSTYGPDYTTMYEKTYEIYQNLDYYIMVPEIAELLDEADKLMEEVEEIGKSLESSSNEVYKRKLGLQMNKLWRRAKLIFGYIDKLEPEYQEMINNYREKLFSVR